MEPERRLLFLINPHAGKKRVGTYLLPMVDLMTKQGYLVTTYPTQGPKDAMRAAREWGGQYDRVVCCGGDGTLNETVRGMLQGAHTVPIGYIPAGSTNDFASSLGLPRQMEQAAKIAAEGDPFRCDAGTLNGSYFVYVAAFGDFAEVSYSTPQQTKNLLGHLAYLLEGMSRLPKLKSYRVRVEFDGQTMEDEFIVGMVTNSLSVGGFKGLCGKDVRLNDGQFEALFIKQPRNVGHWSKLISAVLRQDLNSEILRSIRASSLRFFSEEPISWTIDGEFGGTFQEADVINHRESLYIVAPEQKQVILSQPEKD